MSRIACDKCRRSGMPGRRHLLLHMKDRLHSSNNVSASGLLAVERSLMAAK